MFLNPAKVTKTSLIPDKTIKLFRNGFKDYLFLKKPGYFDVADLISPNNIDLSKLNLFVVRTNQIYRLFESSISRGLLKGLYLSSVI